MDDVLIQYRDEKLGEYVWIKFPVEYSEDDDSENGYGNKFVFYKGLITESKAYLPNRDPTDSREYEHFVYFGDKDDGYYNLADQEATGYLKWSQEEADKAMEEERTKKPSAKLGAARAVPPPVVAAAGASVATGASASMNTEAGTGLSLSRVVTPPKRSRPTENTQAQARKRVKVKLEFGSTTSNIHDPTNNEINVREFEDWLRRVHKGSGGTNISDANARSVMNRVKDLIVEELGVSYKNWPSHVKFHQDETVTLDTDFAELMSRARLYENTYGEDKGHGWLLRHPIKKLELFRDYVQQKRHERANPELID
jgi:hypothetical protein